MENMEKVYKKIMVNIDNTLNDNREKGFIKKQFTDLFYMFFDELSSLKNLYEEKIESILDRQSYFDEKISRIEENNRILEEEINLQRYTDNEELKKMIDNKKEEILKYIESNKLEDDM